MNTNETFYSSISDHYWFAIDKMVIAHWFINSSDINFSRYKKAAVSENKPMYDKVMLTQECTYTSNENHIS